MSPKSRINIGRVFYEHARKRNSLLDCDEILHKDRYPRFVYKFDVDRRRVLAVFLIDLRPYKTVAIPSKSK